MEGAEQGRLEGRGMTQSGVVWAPGKAPRDLAERLVRQYGLSRHVAAAGALAEYFAPILEAHSKEHAPWTDRTGNARQTLFSVVAIQKDRVVLYLSHGMEYGVFLELCNSGWYAIIMKTLQAQYPEIKKAMDDLYR